MEIKGRVPRNSLILLRYSRLIGSEKLREIFRFSDCYHRGLGSVSMTDSYPRARSWR